MHVLTALEEPENQHARDRANYRKMANEVAHHFTTIVRMQATANRPITTPTMTPTDLPELRLASFTATSHDEHRSFNRHERLKFSRAVRGTP